MRRAAAVVACLTGLGGGIPAVFGIIHFARYGRVWTFMGLPTYGNGPLDRAGVETSVPLLLIFLAICVAEVALGWMLWRNRRGAVALSFVLLPFELFFWWGFALPFAFPFGAVRTVLVVGHLARRGRLA
jgi:hypothetical protein